MHVGNSPKRRKLLDSIEKDFKSKGWKVQKSVSELQDLIISQGKLHFYLKCIDETSLSYHSTDQIIAYATNCSDILRSRINRVLLFVLTENFLTVPLEVFWSRGVCAFVANTIGHVSDLGQISSGLPGEVSETQLLLLQKNIEYCVLVSDLYLKRKNLELALHWANCAVDNSIGFTLAHMCLFNVLREIGDYAAVEKFGSTILSYKPSDRQVLLGLADIAKRQGLKEEQNKWEALLAEDRGTSRSFEDILERQRSQNLRALPAQPVDEKDRVLDSAKYAPGSKMGLFSIAAKYFKRGP